MKNLVLILVILTLLFTNIMGQGIKDIEGAKDYTLVPRFQGSYIVWYNTKDFDRYFMLYLKDNNLDKYEVDGKITRLQYKLESNHSIFEILNFYQRALKDSGFTVLLMLDRNNCGVNLSEGLYISEFNGLNSLTGDHIKPDYSDGQFIYLSAKKRLTDKNIYVVVYITQWKDNFPLITFDAIEQGAISGGVLSVKDMDIRISQEGHIAIYDIYFVEGSDEIANKSVVVLKTIADYFTSHKDRKYAIVVHMDNMGELEDNLLLSKRRAEALKRFLVSQYGVDSSQLRAYGVGSLSPVCSNRTDEGRFQNRRVEIVEL